MKKGQTHPSTAMYQELITNAFLTLIQTKKISDITVSELCEKADVARRTYYRHFSKKEDIIEYYSMQFMQSLTQTLMIPFQKGDMYTFVKDFFTVMEPQITYIRIFTENGYGNILFTSYLKSMLLFTELPVGFSSPAIPAASQCNSAYILGGLWSLLIYWFSHGCVQTPDELAVIVTKG